MTVSPRTRKVFRWAGWGLAGLAALAVVALLVYVLVILPRTEIMGAHDEKPFNFDRTMEIKKLAPDGTPYTVNNSTATFRLDVAKPDAHSQLVFSNYTAALAYCQERGLPVIPSVQLVQGRLKQFDDVLCAALELAMAERRVQALKQLLTALRRQPNAEATEHVAAALLLAGVEPEVDEDARRKAEASRTGFLATPEARPCGFWDGDERLIRSFQSDRYLMWGFSVQEAPEACLALSRAIAGDPSLREEFQTLRAFDARLTNPALSVSPEQMEGLTRQELGQRFAPDARFALISYSVSKEQTLIDRLVREGKVNGDTCLMALVIDAVRSGRLKLAPKPDSGWYDYQWHALETLLAPERGRESAKLKLTDAYRKRLENAFATALAKARETQIKRLPMMTLGMNDEPDEPPPKVKVAPEFAAEPTLTVYLRLGRVYRFLRQAMVATLGEEELARVRLAHSACSVDEALRETAGFCYGLYDRLCLEIGQHPAYLPDELTAEEREQARAVFKGWRETWQADPALAADARVAVPVARWPDGRTRSWAAAGVRLEPVVYEYLDKPIVGGRVEAEFVPCAVYLPTDVFLEFERSQPEPLTRAAFRRLCDACRDATALRRSFGAVRPPRARATRLDLGRWVRSHWGWGAIVVAGLLFWRVRRARLWIVIGGVALVVVWVCALVWSPVYRAMFIVRHVATVNEFLGLVSENRLIREIPMSPRLRALSTLLADPDSQTRYLAARFMVPQGWCSDEAASAAWAQPGVKDRLLRAALDENPEVAAFAVLSLGQYKAGDVVDCLLARLPSAHPHDWLCQCVVSTLGDIGDPRAIGALVPLCGDSRGSICYEAIRTLGRFSVPEAQSNLWLLVESPDSVVRRIAIDTVKEGCVAWWEPSLSKEACEARCDAMLAERAGNGVLSFDIRMSLARGIKGAEAQVTAFADLLPSANSDAQANDVLLSLASGCLARCGAQVEIKPLEQIVTNAAARVELANALASRDSGAAKRALETLLLAAKDSTNPSIRGCANRALEELLREPEMRERRQRRR
jgi:hypothetical protein